jgi:hypothetical protein
MDLRITPNGHGFSRRENLQRIILFRDTTDLGGFSQDPGGSLCRKAGVIAGGRVARKGAMSASYRFTSVSVP